MTKHQVVSYPQVASVREWAGPASREQVSVKLDLRPARKP